MQKIDKIWAFIAVEEAPDDAIVSEGLPSEGIVAFKFGDTWIPLVGADEKRINSLRRYAEITVQRTGKPVKLVEFSVRKDLEEIKPKDARVKGVAERS